MLLILRWNDKSFRVFYKVKSCFTNYFASKIYPIVFKIKDFFVNTYASEKLQVTKYHHAYRFDMHVFVPGKLQGRGRD